MGKTHNKNCTKQQSRATNPAPAATTAAPAPNPTAARATSPPPSSDDQPKFFELDVQIEGQGRVELNGNPFVDSERGKVDGQGRSPRNVTLSLTAIAHQGWRFVEWQGDSEAWGKENPEKNPSNPALVVLMDGDKTLTAKFVQTEREQAKADKSSSYAARVAARFKR